MTKRGADWISSPTVSNKADVHFVTCDINRRVCSDSTVIPGCQLQTSHCGQRNGFAVWQSRGALGFQSQRRTIVSSRLLRSACQFPGEHLSVHEEHEATRGLLLGVDPHPQKARTIGRRSVRGLTRHLRCISHRLCRRITAWSDGLDDPVEEADVGHRFWTCHRPNLLAREGVRAQAADGTPEGLSITQRKICHRNEAATGRGWSDSAGSPLVIGSEQIYRSLVLRDDLHRALIRKAQVILPPCG